jgi:hypothetical protein
MFAVNAQQKSTIENDSVTEHNEWLKAKFSEQHNKLTPRVAVADMLYACNEERQIEQLSYKVNNLILKMDKNRLAEKLITCLKEDSMQSDVALNFGLVGCFHEQLAHLPDAERKQKTALVKTTILSLSRNERKKSFTQCVSAQAMHYLQ